MSQFQLPLFNIELPVVRACREIKRRQTHIRKILHTVDVQGYITLSQLRVISANHTARISNIRADILHPKGLDIKIIERRPSGETVYGIGPLEREADEN